MRALKIYEHGGWHPFKKKEESKTTLKMSEREEDVYGTVSQQLADAIESRGEGGQEILKMLSLTPQEESKQFRAARNKQGGITFYKADPESDPDNPTYIKRGGNLSDDELAEMFGRELKSSEKRFIRSEVFRDPALLSYFMGMGEAPTRREMSNITIAKNVGGKSIPGGGGQGSSEASGANLVKVCKEGEGCKLVRQGGSHSWSD